MRSVLKFLGLAVLLVASGAVGAGVYAWIESSPVQVDEPLLTAEQAYDLVWMHIRMDPGVSGYPGVPPSMMADCPPSTKADGGSYIGGGRWLVTVGSCTLMLEDKTGKVIGP